MASSPLVNLVPPPAPLPSVLIRPRAEVVDTHSVAEIAQGLWQRLRETAAEVARREPVLQPRLQGLVLERPTLGAALVGVLSQRLASADMRQPALEAVLGEVLADEPQIVRRFVKDLHALTSRDPACPDPLHGLLHMKGFHALQAYRVAHALWLRDRSELALTLSNQASLVFGVDIHPAAQIGVGVMLDHGSGIVIGETAVVDDNVSILQNVTLGGTGKDRGDRHPKVRCGVMVGAGAKILGNIEIGAMSKVAAGSVVLHAVPPHCTVAGVPARIVRRHAHSHLPALDMDQSVQEA